jgi:hypothetical protein
MRFLTHEYRARGWSKKWLINSRIDCPFSALSNDYVTYHGVSEETE